MTDQAITGGLVRRAPNIRRPASRPAEEVPGFAAVEALAAAVSRDIGEKARNVLRDVLDAYRSVITAAVSRTVTGAQTRRQAAQAAWQQFMARGISGFTNRAGGRVQWRDIGPLA